MMNKNHPFHFVENSPWPIIISMNLLNLLISMISWMHMTEFKMMITSVLIIIINSFQWWRDITRESTFQGWHTKKVMLSTKLGMMLFIISEIMFFVSFFWSFFHSSLSPNIEIGMKWPPMSICVFNPMSIPLLNTTILVSSGISITWTHHSLMKKNNLNQTIQSLIFTILLGLYFSILQMLEYMESSFSMSDSIYGSSFFLATGFHGLHVTIGTKYSINCHNNTIN